MTPLRVLARHRHTPGTLEESINALKDEHKFLLAGGYRLSAISRQLEKAAAGFARRHDGFGFSG